MIHVNLSGHVCNTVQQLIIVLKPQGNTIKGLLNEFDCQKSSKQAGRQHAGRTLISKHTSNSLENRQQNESIAKLVMPFRPEASCDEAYLGPSALCSPGPGCNAARACAMLAAVSCK